MLTGFTHTHIYTDGTNAWACTIIKSTHTLVHDARGGEVGERGKQDLNRR